MDFSEYVAARRTSLVRAAVLLGCPQPDAEDVVQTALLRCFRSWRRVVGADQPEAYVYRVPVNTLNDARTRRWNGELPTEILPDHPAEVHDPTTGMGVRRAPAAMTPQHRQVLVLRYYADLAATHPAAESELGTNVPSVTGLAPEHARQLLDDALLETTVVPSDGDGTCSTMRVVTGQDPAPGEVVVRHTPVILEVAEPDPICGPGELSTDAKRVAEGFVAFARGDRPDGPPVDTPVDLYIGNQFVRTITAEASTDPSSWRDCPAVGHYAGRTCPFSFVKPIADDSATIAYTADAPSHPCLPGGPDPPEGLSAYHAVTLAPDEDLDCTSYWAIQLFVNDVGQIVAANVVWAEP